ncbi:MAG: succinate dehydrogenase cytochrome b subunit [Bacteroidales bacterium]
MSTKISSSIGKKLIMSISGLFLLIFLLVHLTVNSLYLFSDEAFRAGCEFMALPIVTIIVPILAAGFLVHIIYALILTVQNLKARGNIRYAVPTKTITDSWAAKNMIYLGVIILGFLVFHLTHFWAHMQLQDFSGNEMTDPIKLMIGTFKPVWTLILYIVWFVALWLHLTHGFWSAFQTLGWSDDNWRRFVKIVGIVIVTVICLGFVTVGVYAHLRATGTMPREYIAPASEAVAALIPMI